MLLEIACIVAGFLAGMTYAQERDWQRYRRTRDEVKDEISREFDYYKNLSESLKQDLHELKSKK
jgi:Tfp pilus assembly PilM family ATPase